MSTYTSPATEAGRRHVRYLSDAVMPRDAAVIEVLAIEAEARAEGYKDDAAVMAAIPEAYAKGYADALREAAERVRALGGWGVGEGLVFRSAALAILTETDR